MTNPLLDDLNDAGVLPDVAISLPTMGAFYPQGEVLKPGINPAEISIRPLSILDESSFRDPLMMISGHAIAKMVRRVCPEIDDPGQLAELDVQAILIACRLASYGSSLKLEHVCSKCQNKSTLMVDLNEHLLRYRPYTADELMLFDVDIDATGQKVRLRPMIYQDAVDMVMNAFKSNIQAEQYNQSHGEDNTLTDEFIEAYHRQFEEGIKTNLAAICSSIYTVTTKSGKIVMDRQSIEEWILRLSPDLIKPITERIARINMDIRERSKLEYVCDSCQTTNGFYVELDPQRLFMQAEGSVTPANSSALSTNTEKTKRRPSKVSRK